MKEAGVEARPSAGFIACLKRVVRVTIPNRFTKSATAGEPGSASGTLDAATVSFSGEVLSNQRDDPRLVESCEFVDGHRLAIFFRDAHRDFASPAGDPLPVVGERAVRVRAAGKQVAAANRF